MALRDQALFLRKKSRSKAISAQDAVIGLFSRRSEKRVSGESVGHALLKAMYCSELTLQLPLATLAPVSGSYSELSVAPGRKEAVRDEGDNTEELPAGGTGGGCYGPG